MSGIADDDTRASAWYQVRRITEQAPAIDCGLGSNLYHRIGTERSHIRDRKVFSVIYAVPGSFYAAVKYGAAALL